MLFLCQLRALLIWLFVLCQQQHLQWILTFISLALDPRSRYTVQGNNDETTTLRKCCAFLQGGQAWEEGPTQTTHRTSGLEP